MKSLVLLTALVAVAFSTPAFAAVEKHSAPNAHKTAVTQSDKSDNSQLGWGRHDGPWGPHDGPHDDPWHHDGPDGPHDGPHDNPWHHDGPDGPHDGPHHGW
ncbi:MAG TPA: hypothetical protein V6D47_04835 [Oscillatoriaceae cyanobacterium]